MPSLLRRTWVAILLAGAARTAAAQSAPAATDSLSLSLEDAVGRALRAGDEVRLAAAQIDVATAQLEAARAAALPQLRLTGGYTRVFQSARGQAVGQVFNQPHTYTTAASLSQPVYQGGRVFAGWRAAAAVSEAARLTSAEVGAQVAVDVQSAYLQALFANRILEIRAGGFELATGRLTQVEQFQRAGRAARYDVLRARVDRANLEPLVIQARSDLDLALLSLKRIINVPAERPLRLTTTLDARAVQVLAASLTESAARAGAAERPAVRAGELTVRARREAVRIARADLLPTVSLFYQSGYQAFPATSAFPTTTGRTSPELCPEGSAGTRACNNGGWFSDRQLGVTLSWSLFDGLRTKGNIDLAQAQARIAELQLAQQREAVAVEVARAEAELRRARSAFTARQQNASEADESYRLASLRFTRGLATQLEVSDAQLALLTAQTDQARATLDLYLASAELARSLGRPVPLPGGAAPASSTSSLDGGRR